MVTYKQYSVVHGKQLVVFSSVRVDVGLYSIYQGPPQIIKRPGVP